MVTATPVFVQTPNLAVNTVTTTTGTSAVTVVTGSANGSKVIAFMGQSNTTSSSIFTLSLSTGGGTAKRLATVGVNAAATADLSGAAFDFFSPVLLPGLPVDNDGQRYLFLPSASYSLTVTATATISTAGSKTVDFAAVYADF